jgi:DNA-binding GntR family transcriptional regulator
MSPRPPDKTRSSPGVRVVKPQSVVDQVVAELRRSIVFGTLEPGQEFALREIAANLGVSTAPVREALRVLQGDGLIVGRRARSAVVAPMDAADLRAVYRLRRLVEPDIGARACTLVKASDLARISRIVDALGDESLGVEEIYDSHREFHLALLRPAATAWDLRVIEMLWHAAERYVRVGFGRRDPMPDEPRRRKASHAKVLAAFRTRDGATARRALVDHLDATEQLALEMIA